MTIESAAQLYKKLDEAVRGLVAFNAGGSAAVVAIANKTSPTGTLHLAGFVFLVGVIAGVAAWIFSIPGPPPEPPDWGRDPNSEMKRITIALYIAAAAFLFGVFIAFISI